MLSVHPCKQGSPKQDLGASGRVSSLVGPHFVMMGDAAHSVKPNLGQGCNSGLQDAHIFAQVQHAQRMHLPRLPVCCRPGAWCSCIFIVSGVSEDSGQLWC